MSPVAMAAALHLDACPKGSQARPRVARSGRPIGAASEASWREIRKLADSAGDFSNPENPLFDVYDALADWETQLKHAGVDHARTKPPEPRL
jgi:hypothetical protein